MVISLYSDVFCKFGYGWIWRRSNFGITYPLLTALVHSEARKMFGQFLSCSGQEGPKEPRSYRIYSVWCYMVLSFFETIQKEFSTILLCFFLFFNSCYNSQEIFQYMSILFGGIHHQTIRGWAFGNLTSGILKTIKLHSFSYHVFQVSIYSALCCDP